MHNLLRNALQATAPGGKVEVRVGGDGDKVWLEIRDTGPGIPEELRDRMFEPFVTGRHGRGGTGLGLAITRDIVAAHGGGIQALAQSRGRHRDAGRAADTTGELMRIQIIDDEPVLQDVLATLLRREGFQVLQAGTAAEGLRQAEEAEVDLVLLDLMLPDKPGLEVLKEFKARDPEVVVVVITAYSSVETAIAAMREGAFHYIAKPFKNQEVVLTVRKGLEQRRLRTENRDLRQRLEGLGTLVWRSQVMERVIELVRRAAPSRSNILLTGESGHRQGAPGARHPPTLPSRRGVLRRRQHGLGADRPAGVDAVRSRARRVHGRRREQAWPASRWPTAVPSSSTRSAPSLRRPRPSSCRVIQEREFIPVGSEQTVKVDVRDHRRHQRRPQPHGGRRPLPRGPVLPPQRGHDRAAAAAQPARGHPGARRPLPASLRG